MKVLCVSFKKKGTVEKSQLLALEAFRLGLEAGACSLTIT
jgi:hypothetical protein